MWAKKNQENMCGPRRRKNKNMREPRKNPKTCENQEKNQNM